MKLIITASASEWFQKKFNLKSGDGVKFYGKTTQPHHVKHGPVQGFAVERSLGDAAITLNQDGINYHINFNDEWFFSGLVTLVDYQPGSEAPVFHLQKEVAGQAVDLTNFTDQDVDATTGASSKFEDYWE